MQPETEGVATHLRCLLENDNAERKAVKELLTEGWCRECWADLPCYCMAED